jgi:hypothetical protein
MANQIVAILCEGPHDVAFITKVIKTIGFRSNEDVKIGSYPCPMDRLLKAEVIKSDVESLNIHEIRQVLLPSSTLANGNNYLFLYSMGGDKKKETRQRLLSDFFAFIPKQGEISISDIETNLSIVYFFDADKLGIKARINSINDEINAIIGAKPFTDHKQTKIHEKLKLGAFIFTGSDNDKGKLEDLVLPLMKRDNEKIFDGAKSYLDGHYDKERVRYFDEYKSCIGITGQLQNSGSSNVTCIASTDYINPKKIAIDPKCQELAHYLDLFIKTQN